MPTIGTNFCCKVELARIFPQSDGYHDYHELHTTARYPGTSIAPTRAVYFAVTCLLVNLETTITSLLRMTTRIPARGVMSETLSRKRVDGNY